MEVQKKTVCPVVVHRSANMENVDEDALIVLVQQYVSMIKIGKTV
jgi:hypothetical protein